MTLTFTRVWIIVSTFLAGTGWVLSALHQLNRFGYAAAFVVGATGSALILRRCRWPRMRLPRRRFRRFLPLAFLVLAALIVAGGLLYAPNNYDALSYRVPRPLHWLADGGWSWIRASDARLNTRAADSEWIMAPLLLFTRSERWLWLGNAAMFLALPGLIFSLFTRAGVPAKVAWRWMWVVPTGYVFVLQAGGISTDLPGAFYTAAAVALALRASARGTLRDLWCSLLAVALSQGVKASNAPLALVWLLASLPAWRLAMARPAATVGVALAAALVSFLPSAALNVHFCGDWSGSRVEMGEFANGSPAVMVTGNAISLLVQNFSPPIFPLSGKWNSAAPKLFSADWRGRFAQSFEAGGLPWRTVDMQIEDEAPQGIGVSLLLVSALAAALLGKGKSISRGGWRLRALRWSPWVASLFFMAKVNLLDSGRLIAAYYPLLPLPLLALRGQTALVRGAWWRRLAALQIASAALLLVISPSRPLWPALTILQKLAAGHPNSAAIARMKTVFETYRVRSDALRAVREAMPPASVIGLIATDDLETSLWRPFGARRLVAVLKDDSRRQLEAEGIETIVIDPAVFARQTFVPLDDWLRRLDAEKVGSVEVLLRAKDGPVAWDLVRLRPSPGPPASHP